MCIRDRLSIVDNIDVQSAFSWAPKVARKCESKHWYACGAGGRSVGHVITKFSGMGRFIYPWCARGAPLLGAVTQDTVAVSMCDRTFPR